MITAKDVADYAALAQAAYTDFGTFSEPLTASVLSDRLSQRNDKAYWPKERADDFAKHWRVVDHVVDDGRRFQLSAGMQTNAEIWLGDRTVMEYLLSPVRKAWHEAGRER